MLLSYGSSYSILLMYSADIFSDLNTCARILSQEVYVMCFTVLCQLMENSIFLNRILVSLIVCKHKQILRRAPFQTLFLHSCF